MNFSKKEGDLIKTIRDMDSAKLIIKDDYLAFQFKSKSFLRQQIRRMVKKILELGKGEINYSNFLDLFDESKEFSYQPADPKGLILWNIEYDNEIEFLEDQKSIDRRNQFFLTKGEFQPEGADEPLTVTTNRSHPPYHDGCDCGIMASL